MKTNHKHTARRSATADELITRYLPPRDGKTSADQLKAIAWQALEAGSKSIQPALTYQEREEAFAHLLEIGIRCTLDYDPARDTAPESLSLNRRFTAYTITRMRQRLIDWKRTTRGDTRPGRTQRDTVDISPYLENADSYSRMDHHADAFTEPDFTDRAASRLRVERWTQAAAIAGLTTQEFVLLAADYVAADWITRGEAA